MPQTLLALLALVLASFLTFNQQRLTARSHHNLVTDELELAAAGLASEIVAMIDGRSFDENSTPEAIGDADGDMPEGADAFTSGSTFGAADRGAEGCDLLRPASTPDCDDVDDVSSDEWRPVDIQLAHDRTLPFEVRTQVYYVSDPESMAVSADPTLHKRVLIDVRSRYMAYADEGLYRATRVVSYDPIKAEMDYENSEYYDPTYGSGTEENGGDTETNENGGD